MTCKSNILCVFILNEGEQHCACVSSLKENNNMPNKLAVKKHTQKMFERSTKNSFVYTELVELRIPVGRKNYRRRNNRTSSLERSSFEKRKDG